MDHVVQDSSNVIHPCLGQSAQQASKEDAHKQGVPLGHDAAQLLLLLLCALHLDVWTLDVMQISDHSKDGAAGLPAAEVCALLTAGQPSDVTYDKTALG